VYIQMTRAACLLGLIVFAAAGCEESAFRSRSERHELAVVDGRPITLADLERRIAELPENQRPRDRAGLERLLAEVVDLAVFEAEARHLEFVRSARAGAARTSAMAELELGHLAEGLPHIDTIRAEEVARYYRDHLDRYTTPELRRVAVGSFSSRAAASAARARPLEGARDLGLVRARHASDASGDVPMNAAVPEAFVRAVFGLSRVGDVSEPIDHEGQVWLVAYTGGTAPQLRTLANEDANIRRKILQERYEAARARYLREARASTPVSIDEAALGVVEVVGDNEAYDPAQWKKR
jgi:hypothetical protein